MYCIFEISNDILIIKNTLTLSTIANDEIHTYIHTYIHTLLTFLIEAFQRQ